MPKILLSFCVLVLLLPSIASAQRVGKVRGAGTSSCGELIQARASGVHELQYAQWSMGVVSGYNLYGIHPQVTAPDSSTILLHADKFCRDNPLSDYAESVFALIADLGGYKFGPAKK